MGNKRGEKFRKALHLALIRIYLGLLLGGLMGKIMKVKKNEKRIELR